MVQESSARNAYFSRREDAGLLHALDAQRAAAREVHHRAQHRAPSCRRSRADQAARRRGTQVVRRGGDGARIVGAGVALARRKNHEPRDAREHDEPAQPEKQRHVLAVERRPLLPSRRHRRHGSGREAEAHHPGRVPLDRASLEPDRSAVLADAGRGRVEHGLSRERRAFGVDNLPGRAVDRILSAGREQRPRQHVAVLVLPYDPGGTIRQRERAHGALRGGEVPHDSPPVVVALQFVLPGAFSSLHADTVHRGLDHGQPVGPPGGQFAEDVGERLRPEDEPDGLGDDDGPAGFDVDSHVESLGAVGFRRGGGQDRDGQQRRHQADEDGETPDGHGCLQCFQ